MNSTSARVADYFDSVSEEFDFFDESVTSVSCLLSFATQCCGACTNHAMHGKVLAKTELLHAQLYIILKIVVCYKQTTQRKRLHKCSFCDKFKFMGLNSDE